MFEQAVLSSGPASKRVWTTFAGVTGQALLVTFAVMIPMIWPEAMPSHQTLLKIFVPGVPPGPTPKNVGSAPQVVRAAPKPFNEKGLVMPGKPPEHPQMFVDPPEMASGPGPAGPYVPGGSGSGSPDGVAGLWGDTVTAIPAPRPVVAHHEAAAPAPEPTITRVRAGGNVHLGTLIHRIDPVYPRMAIAAHISGVVELEGVVGIDGHIRELKLKHGHPLLTQAAIDAVRQWVYEPTTLNGDRVEIIAPITVTFHLN